MPNKEQRNSSVRVWVRIGLLRLFWDLGYGLYERNVGSEGTENKKDHRSPSSSLPLFFSSFSSVLGLFLGNLSFWVCFHVLILVCFILFCFISPLFWGFDGILSPYGI